MNYCPACGKRLQIDTGFCDKCGRKLEPYALDEPPWTGDSDAVVIDKADPTFYVGKDGVRVTATRLIVPANSRKDGAVTYSMANIASIKTEKNESARIAGALVAVLGIVIIAARDYLSFSSAVSIGIVLLIAGLLTAVIMRPVYRLKITSAAGEDEPFKSRRKEEFERIVNAINEALIKRG